MNKIVAEIRIAYDGANVLLNGPLHDKIMCLGMIELAKQVVLNDAKVNRFEVPPPPQKNGSPKLGPAN